MYLNPHTNPHPTTLHPTTLHPTTLHPKLTTQFPYQTSTNSNSRLTLSQMNQQIMQNTNYIRNLDYYNPYKPTNIHSSRYSSDRRSSYDRKSNAKKYKPDIRFHYYGKNKLSSKQFDTVSDHMKHSQSAQVNVFRQPHTVNMRYTPFQVKNGGIIGENQLDVRSQGNRFEENILTLSQENNFNQYHYQQLLKPSFLKRQQGQYPQYSQYGQYGQPIQLTQYTQPKQPTQPSPPVQPVQSTHPIPPNVLDDSDIFLQFDHDMKSLPIRSTSNRPLKNDLTRQPYFGNKLSAIPPSDQPLTNPKKQQKQQNEVSPLSTSTKTWKDKLSKLFSQTETEGRIITVVLIALGIMIFLLQAI